jgi:hypothetical protein
VRETVSEALDWREQFRKRPIAFSVGALSVGFILGYSIAGTFKGDDRAYYDDEEAGTEGLRSQIASPASSYYAGASQPAAESSYAAQALTGGSTDFDGTTGSRHRASAYTPAASSVSSRNLAAVSGTPMVGQDTATAEEEEPKGPGLVERFKTTKAYDRLEEEVSALGDRFIDELSKTAQSVVLPALFSKVKELFGVDLSNKGNAGGGAKSQRTETNAALSGGAQSSFAGVNRGSSVSEDDNTLSGRAGGEGAAVEGETSKSYATSENRGYGASAGGGGDYKRGSD